MCSGQKTDLFLIENNIIIEIDEYDHVHRDFEYEKRRQAMIESKLAVHLSELILMLQILTLIE